MTTKAKTLNKDQQQEAVKLFRSGTSTYRAIADKLDVDYNAVNKFMTQWKRAKGIIPPAKKKGAKKISVSLPNVSTDIEKDLRIARLEAEIQVLNNFIQTHISKA
jgi:transposase-like protein